MRTNLLVLLTILSPLPAMAITASGTVSDKEGPLISATVLDKSTPGKGTTTDLEGKFTLDVPDDAQIEIRYVGYVAQTLTPSENMNIILQEDSTILQEVVSIGTFTPANCNQELLTAAHATAGKTAMNTDGNGIHCVPSKCMRGYKLNTKNKQCEEIVCEGPRYVINAAQTDCEDQVGKECNSNDANAKKAKYKWEENQLKCVIQTCNKGYRPNDTGTACEVSDGPCSEEQVKAIEHATAGELKKGVCYATECEGGYEPTKDGQCTAISGNCSPMPDNAKSAHREYSTESNAEVCIIDECKDGYTISPDKLSCTENPKPRLSEEDSKAKIEELRENAQAMKDKEQSTANKLIGAAGIGATGIGAMQAASAMAEQNADEDAEQAMKAYLETFHCNYGGGINIKGGETEIELPGGNDLVSLYTEYAMLANDLKIRKEALGLKAGIESEVLIDKATSGLYDDVSLGKTGGAYASIARALMDETSADAEAWAAQKSETASKLKTGMITAGVGAAGSLIANLAVNSGDKNKSDTTKDGKDTKETDKLKNVASNLQKQQCSGGKQYNDKTKECVCPSDKPIDQNGTCVAAPANCKKTGLVNTSTCQCISNAVETNGNCACTQDYVNQDGKCVKPTTTTTVGATTAAGTTAATSAVAATSGTAASDTAAATGATTVGADATQYKYLTIQDKLWNQTRPDWASFLSQTNDQGYSKYWQNRADALQKANAFFDTCESAGGYMSTGKCESINFGTPSITLYCHRKDLYRGDGDEAIYTDIDNQLQEYKKTHSDTTEFWRSMQSQFEQLPDMNRAKEFCQEMTTAVNADVKQQQSDSINDTIWYYCELKLECDY